MLLLLFYQGSYAAFADVPILRQGGVPHRVKRKRAETYANPFAALEQQIAAAEKREAKATVALAAMERAAAETQAKATLARRTAAIARYTQTAASARTEIIQLNAAMAVEQTRIRDIEEADIIFILTILSEV